MFNRNVPFIANQPETVVAALVVLACFLVWGSLFILLRYLLAYRKLTNAERLQMIEAGQSAELLRSFDGQASRNRFLAVAMALGLFVPCAAMFGATWVTIESENQFAVALIAWVCAAVASVVSTICATIIVTRLCRSAV